MKASKITGQDHLVIKQDNTSAVLITENQGQHAPRVKHMDVKDRFIGHHITNGNIVLERCPTEKMWANFLTKPVGPSEHDAATNNLGMRSLAMLQEVNTLITPRDAAK